MNNRLLQKILSLIIFGISLLACAVLVELVLTYFLFGSMGDTRSRFKVAKESSATRGNSIVPAVYPPMFFNSGIKVKDDRVMYPLTGISNSETIFCNESGTYATYISDRHGFNNPDSLWENPSGIILIGDSFVHGSCVNYPMTIGGQINTRNPNLRVLSLGVGGTSLISQLAIIREFAPSVKARKFYWFLYEGNDLGELESEYSTPALRPYVDSIYFKQGLILQKEVLDEAINQWLAASARAQLGELPPIITMRATRSVIASFRSGPPEISQNAISLLDKVLDLILKNLPSNQGNEITLVYLPSIYRYNGFDLAKLNKIRDMVFEKLKTKGVDYIDMTRSFEKISNPKSLFPAGMHIHYNESGYALVAKSIIEHFQENKVSH